MQQFSNRGSTDLQSANTVYYCIYYYVLYKNAFILYFEVRFMVEILTWDFSQPRSCKYKLHADSIMIPGVWGFGCLLHVSVASENLCRQLPNSFSCQTNAPVVTDDVTIWSHAKLGRHSVCANEDLVSTVCWILTVADLVKELDPAVYC